MHIDCGQEGTNINVRYTTFLVPSFCGKRPLFPKSNHSKHLLAREEGFSLESGTGEKGLSGKGLFFDFRVVDGNFSSQ